jgi:hypothetical protein
VQDLVDLLQEQREQHRREATRMSAYADATEAWLQEREDKRGFPWVFLAAFVFVIAVVIVSSVLAGAPQ